MCIINKKKKKLYKYSYVYKIGEFRDLSFTSFTFGPPGASRADGRKGCPAKILKGILRGAWEKCFFQYRPACPQGERVFWAVVTCAGYYAKKRVRIATALDSPGDDAANTPKVGWRLLRKTVAATENCGIMYRFCLPWGELQLTFMEIPEAWVG